MKKLALTVFVSLSFVIMIGQGWETLTTGVTTRIYDIHFPDGQSDIGYAACMDGAYDNPGTLLKTTDKGDTWTVILPVSGTLDGLEAVFFTSVDTGYIAGWNDYFAKTTDGGDTWTELTLSTSGKSFLDIEFWDADNGVALCSTPATWDAFVYVTGDGGDTWTEASGEPHGFASLSYSDANTLFAVGAPDQKISKSTDGGLTWSLNHTGNPTLFLLGVDFAGDYGIAVGQYADTYITTDQGSTWTFSTQPTSDNFQGIHVFNSDSTIFGGMKELMYKTTNGGITWTTEYDGPGSNHFYTIFFTSDKYGYAGASGGIILRKEAPLNADFSADVTTVCSGSSVQFTDLSTGTDSWSWTFEGGTPATSTDQNPTVTYNSPGTYNVELTVSDGVESDSELKVNYITVVELPGQANLPVGDEEVCTDGLYNYITDEVLYAEDYEWEISPSNAGTLSVDLNTAELSVTSDWTGDFTLRVRALNLCGDAAWSDNLEGTVFQGPSVYIIEGGGSYCSGDEGVEITLSGSESDVNYELNLDDTPTGNIVTGTGSEISFGLITEEGYYTITADNSACMVPMDDQVQIVILVPPVEPSAPTGPEVICEETSSDYVSSGSEDADSYEWEISPEEAGTISGNDLNATVNWNAEFTGVAMISLYGVNDCGAGESSEAIEVYVGAPNPEIAGETMVCDWSDENYMVADNEGSTYTWEVTSGTITEGQGTYMVTVSWEGEGNGTLTVSEETVGGCEGDSEMFEIVIDDCTGIQDKAKESSISLSPNPVKDFVVITSKEKMNGLKLVTIRGSVLKSVNLNEKQYKLRTLDLNPGIYLLKIKSSKGDVTQRLIIN